MGWGAPLMPVLYPLSTSLCFAHCRGSQAPSGGVAFLLPGALHLGCLQRPLRHIYSHILYSSGREGSQHFQNNPWAREVETRSKYYRAPSLWIVPKYILESFSEGPQWARSPLITDVTSSTIPPWIGFPSFSISLSPVSPPSVSWAQIPKYWLL